MVNDNRRPTGIADLEKVRNQRRLTNTFRHLLDEARAKAIQSITEYIEIFYRRQRKQARLGYLSPAVFERQFYEKRLAA